MPILQWIFIAIIWGIVPVTAQFRNYSSWQEYWRQASPCLLFLAGFMGSLGMSFYKYYLDYKNAKTNRQSNSISFYIFFNKKIIFSE